MFLLFFFLGDSEEDSSEIYSAYDDDYDIDEVDLISYNLLGEMVA